MGPGRKKQLPAESNGSITLDNKWYGNCKKRGPCRLNFLHQFCPSREGTQQYLLGLHQVECTLIRLQVIVFGGPIALHGLVHFLNTTGPSLTKTVSYMIFLQMFLHMFAWSLLGSCETLKNWPDVASTGWIVVLPGHQWTLGN